MLVDGEEDEEAGGGGQARAPRAVSCALERLVARNEDAVGAGAGRSGLGAFQGARAPSISIGSYLDRMARYGACSHACFVVGYIYVDRLAHTQPASPVVSLNVHRLILTGVLIASKVLEDLHHNNAFFARVGGISNSELNRLELELLSLLDFRVAVSCSVFESYCLHLEKQMLIWGAVEMTMTKTKQIRVAEDRNTSEAAVPSGNGDAPSSSPAAPMKEQSK